ncbi:hypothetical protein D3C71_25550 [compost metagenome]
MPLSTEVHHASTLAKGLQPIKYSPHAQAVLAGLKAAAPNLYNRVLCLLFEVWVYQVEDLPENARGDAALDKFVVTAPAEVEGLSVGVRGIDIASTEDEAWALGVTQLELERVYARELEQRAASYSYFVHYHWWGEGAGPDSTSQGKGMMHLTRSAPISTWEDVEELAKFIAQEKGFATVVIGNWHQFQAPSD